MRDINISLPNLINICVDEIRDGEISGRMYHCYDSDPVLFANIIELLREAEKLFDQIRYPQASTRARSFHEKGTENVWPAARPQKVIEQKDLILYTGKIRSFITGVRFRQNSTWQGEFTVMENGNRYRFGNTLDFIKLLDQELNNL